MTVPEQYPVFVYGTLRRGGLFHGIIGSYIEKEVPAKLHGMQILQLGDFPALVFDETATEPAVGEALYFYKDWWAAAVEDMDRIESEGHLYIRTQVVVTLENGEEEKVWTYVLNTKQVQVERLRKVKGNDWKLRKAKNADFSERSSRSHFTTIKRILTAAFTES